jgi:hypothetical protein
MVLEKGGGGVVRDKKSRISNETTRCGIVHF